MELHESVYIHLHVPPVRTRSKNQGGYIFLFKGETVQSLKSPSEMPKPNVYLHVECKIMKNVTELVIKAEMGAQYKHCQTGE